MKCIRCGEETENRWPSNESQGLCNGLPLVHGTPEHEAAYRECAARAQAERQIIMQEHGEALYATVTQVDNGVPLALVQVWPTPGDLVLDTDGEQWAVVKRQSSYWTVSLARGEYDAEADCYEETSGLFESCTHDGLYWARDGERDGYQLWLMTPTHPPGQRQWKIQLLDRLRPQVVLVDVVRTIEVYGESGRG